MRSWRLRNRSKSWNNINRTKRPWGKGAFHLRRRRWLMGAIAWPAVNKISGIGVNQVNLSDAFIQAYLQGLQRRQAEQQGPQQQDELLPLPHQDDDSNKVIVPLSVNGQVQPNIGTSNSLYDLARQYKPPDAANLSADAPGSDFSLASLLPAVAAPDQSQGGLRQRRRPRPLPSATSAPAPTARSRTISRACARTARRQIGKTRSSTT
jgi:hypothetical protein